MRKLFLANILLLLFTWNAANAQESLMEPKSSLPEFSVPVLSSPDKFLTNKMFIGQVSIFNIWASWCKYCQMEHPFLLKIKSEYKVPIYGLNIKDNPADAALWLQQHGNPFELCGVDEQARLAEELGNTGTPETLLIDKYGIIRYRHTGVMDDYVWKTEIWPRIQAYQKEN